MNMSQIISHFQNATDINVSISILYMKSPGLQKVNIQITGKKDDKNLSRFIATDVSKLADVIKTLLINHIQFNQSVTYSSLGSFSKTSLKDEALRTIK